VRFDGVHGDFLKDLLGRQSGPPTPNLFRSSGIKDDPGQVEWAGRLVTGNFVGAKTIFAPVTQLPERSG
jgi:hypothetical protein